MRLYTCQDCPPGTPEHEAGARGPLPDRCPAHREQRERRRETKSRRFRVVDPEETPAAPVPEPQAAPPAPPRAPRAPASDPEPYSGSGGVLAALLEDLDGLSSKHPAAETLRAIAIKLAGILDDPMTDPKDAPSASKELRATVQALTEFEEAEEDDLFSGSAPVLVPTTG